APLEDANLDRTGDRLVDHAVHRRARLVRARRGRVGSVFDVRLGAGHVNQVVRRQSPPAGGAAVARRPVAARRARRRGENDSEGDETSGEHVAIVAPPSPPHEVTPPPSRAISYALRVKDRPRSWWGPLKGRWWEVAAGAGVHCP